MGNEKAKFLIVSEAGQAITGHDAELLAVLSGRGSGILAEANERVENRMELVFLKALASDIAPVLERLARIKTIESPDVQRDKLQEFLRELIQLKGDIMIDPSSARAMEEIIAEGLANGFNGADNVANSGNPNHDERGRFTFSDGLTAKEREKEGEDDIETMSVGGEKMTPFNPHGKDTQELFQKPNGEWTDERKTLHEVLVNDAKQKGKPVKNPEFVLLGGGPASGKSTVIKNGMVKLADSHVLVNADEYKAALPEYIEKFKAKDTTAASYVHEESSYLAKRTLSESFKESRNVVLDGTGNAGVESVMKKVNEARAAGYAVRGEYVTCNTETAVKRSDERAIQTGRKVPESMLRHTHKSVSAILPELVKGGTFDSVALHDTNAKEPRLVMTAEGTQMKIHDEKLWRDFLNKANE